MSKSQEIFFFEERRRVLEKTRRFFVFYLNKHVQGLFSDIDLKKVYDELQYIVANALPAFAQVCAENKNVLFFLKALPEAKKYWDELLNTFHKSFFMPKNFDPKKPQPGFHSLDLILGYFHAIETIKAEKENNIELSNAHLKNGLAYKSYYALTFCMTLLLNEKKQLPRETLLEIKTSLFSQTNTLNACYGTPGYIYSAYALLKLCEFFPLHHHKDSEENKEISQTCYYFAAVFLETAKKLYPLCKASLQNLMPLQPNAKFKTFEDLFLICKNLVDNYFQSSKNNLANISNEAEREMRIFLETGNFDPKGNVVHIKYH